jgi:hypothetical protein
MAVPLTALYQHKRHSLPTHTEDSKRYDLLGSAVSQVPESSNFSSARTY